MHIGYRKKVLNDARFIQHLCNCKRCRKLQSELACLKRLIQRALNLILFIFFNFLNALVRWNFLPQINHVFNLQENTHKYNLHSKLSFVSSILNKTKKWLSKVSSDQMQLKSHSIHLKFPKRFRFDPNTCLFCQNLSSWSFNFPNYSSSIEEPLLKIE